ncbi:hypothetical protein DH2020_017062 [Rehmannia glutinosa]|uniref:rRNA methylase YtqB n=1 Tax=Rehmannia glutinosa TaxID=99300 RepID=A0ABR0WPS7_REHGL
MAFMGANPNSYISLTCNINKLQNNLKLLFSAPPPSSLFSSKLRSITRKASIFTRSVAENDVVTSQVEVPSSNSITKHHQSPFSGLEEVMTGYMFGKKKATEVAHAVWKNVVRKGDLVIDATCGNGYDTLALLRLIADDACRGRVFAMDLQKDALESTSSLLDRSVTADEKKQVELYSMCHTRMEELVPKGGDKKIKTESETTLLALDAAKKIVAPGGLISILAYVGHSGGREEFEKVQSFAAELPIDNWVCCKLQMLNRPLAPWVLIVVLKNSSNFCVRCFFLAMSVVQALFDIL